MIQIENYLAGKTIKDATGYSYFLPNQINEGWVWQDQDLNVLLETAAIKLGELNSFSRLVPNIDLFIKMYITKEAIISSRIEGTKTQMDEAFLDEADISPQRKDDWQEVNNYIKALNQAVAELATLPISSRLIKNTHKILLNSVRGKDKLPGEYRSSQNWIGGNTLADASFIPPHHSYVAELMGDFEKFLNNDNIKIANLIKIGIAHYQLETIHPFLDGNGRIGRLLIPLLLVDKKLLSKPLLYLSTFFESNKTLYYDNLTFVRTKNDIRQWLKYFLVGVATTATNATQTLSDILELKARWEGKIASSFGKRIKNANQLLQYLLKKPVVNVTLVKTITHSSYKTANDLVMELVNVGLLKEMTGQNRNRVFVFDEYLNLFK